MRRPRFAIIGAQKCASTLLQENLSSQNSVHIPREEVSVFEDPDYSTFDEKKFTKKVCSEDEKKISGFKRSDCLHRPEVPKRIRNHFPNIKLISVLRDPVDRAISAYFHQMKHGFIPVVDIDTGLKNIISGKWSERYPRSKNIINYGMYKEQIDRYLSLFSEKQVHLETFAELVAETKKTIKRVTKFIGVEDFKLSRGLTNNNPKKGVYSKVRLNILRLRNKVSHKYYDGGKRFEVKSKYSLGGILGGAITILDRYLGRYVFDGGKPKLDKSIEDELINIYKEDSTKLSKKTDLNISHWKTVVN